MSCKQSLIIRQTSAHKIQHNRILFRRVSIIHFCTTNADPTQLIKRLHQKKHSFSRNNVMKHGFDIYHQLNNSLNPSFLISFLKLMLHCNYSDKIQLVWTDIQESIDKHSNSKDNICNVCSLWLECCIESNKMDINKCVEMLKWTESETHCNQLQMKGYLINKLISKCCNNKEANALEYIHCLIDKDFFVGQNENIIIQNALINAYGNYKDHQKATNVFNGIAKKDEISLSAMMKVLIQCNQHLNALQLYLKCNTLQNTVTDMLGIKMCIKTNNLLLGKKIHEKYKNENIDSIQLNNALIDFYGHFGDTNGAELVYENIENGAKNTATINALMKCLINGKKYENALELYDVSLLNNKIKVNDIIHTLAIKACGFRSDLEKGNKIRENIKNLNDKKTNKAANALIEFYFKCNDVSAAKLLFDGLKHENIQSINAMIKGFVHLRQYEIALFYYDSITAEKDEVSHLFAIKSCMLSGDLIKGKEIHKNIEVFIKNNPNCIAIHNALIDFYGYFSDLSSANNFSVSNLDHN